MTRVLAACLAAAVALGATAADELDIARSALRDGLWEVARTHAQLSDGPAARMVVAESYAREGKWKELLSALEGWGEPDGDALAYYRALALTECGRGPAAEFFLAGRVFSDAACVRLVTRLRARIAQASGGAAEALKVVKSGPALPPDEDAEMYAAGLMAATGDRAGAEGVWREVAARGTNASERAFAVASANLGDVKLLRAAYARCAAGETKRLAGFGLGRALMKDKATLDEGVALVRGLVREAPDAAGARDGFVAIADAYLANGRLKESVDAYRLIFETWPEAARLSSLHDGLGWALEGLGRHDEALEAFVRAEETAATDADKAAAAVKQGDVLAAAGKPDEALAKYRAVLERHPGTEPARRVEALVRLRELEDRGREMFREYRFAEAQEVFREVAAKDASRKARMDYYETLCLYGQGLDDEAAARARTLAESSPDGSVRAAATLWLAKHSYNRGAWAESRKLFEAYAESSPAAPDAPDALVWAANAALAEKDYPLAIQTVTKLAERHPTASALVRGYLVQGESLVELARFDEAVLVLERAARAEGADPADALRARLLGADALFAMGADNPVRYQEALDAYRNIRLGESLDPSSRLSISYKVAKTLEKLKRTDEAADRYYTDVVLAYREGRAQGLKYDDEARAAFSRAAFRLADEYESRGKDFQAAHVLELVATSDVPAAAEAEKRIARIQRKGNFL